MPSRFPTGTRATRLRHHVPADVLRIPPILIHRRWNRQQNGVGWVATGGESGVRRRAVHGRGVGEADRSSAQTDVADGGHASRRRSAQRAARGGRRTRSCGPRGRRAAAPLAAQAADPQVTSPSMGGPFTRRRLGSQPRDELVPCMNESWTAWQRSPPLTRSIFGTDWSSFASSVTQAAAACRR